MSASLPEPTEHARYEALGRAAVPVLRDLLQRIGERNTTGWLLAAAIDGKVGAEEQLLAARAAIVGALWLLDEPHS